MAIMRLAANLNLSNIIFGRCEVYRHEKFFNSIFEDSNINLPIFYGCKFDNCIFKSSDLNNSKFFEFNEFENCHFLHCDMRNIGVGNNGLYFKKTEFNACDMRGMNLESTSFFECTFEKCKIISVTFHANKIQKSSFNGTLIDVKFEGDGKEKLELDFKKSKFQGVEFHNIDLSQSVPPKIKNHYYVSNLKYRCSNALVKLNSDKTIDENIKKILSRRIKKLSGNEDYIFNYKFIEDIEGSDFAKNFFDILEISLIN